MYTKTNTRSYKFRLYPNAAQRELIERTFGCCRYVYNRCLEQRIDQYKRGVVMSSEFEQSVQLTAWKKEPELEWLREVDSNALRAAITPLNRAFRDYFRRKNMVQNPDYPRYKSKHDTRQSYQTRADTIKVLDKAVQLPKLGRVKCRVSRPIEGHIQFATVMRTSSGKYFVSLCCKGIKVQPLPPTGTSVGLDVGIKTYVVTSDGTEYANPKYLAKSEETLAKLKHQLSRKTKGSKRYEKARVQLARLQEHIANQRRDSIQKLTTQLVRANDAICIEDLAIDNMKKNHSLAKSVSDAAWGEFRRELEYKAEQYGRQLITIDRFFPSSQICHVCGTRWSGTKDLSVREWACPQCGTVHDRDHNAAINIRDEGLRIAA